MRRLLGHQRLAPGGQSNRKAGSLHDTGWKRSLWLHLAFADIAFQTPVRFSSAPITWLQCYATAISRKSEVDLRLNFDDHTAQLLAWRLRKAIAARPDIAFFSICLSYEISSRSILRMSRFPIQKRGGDVGQRYMKR